MNQGIPIRQIIFIPVIICSLCLLSMEGIAQINLGVGYTSKARNLGSPMSNEGIALRLGVDILKGDYIAWGLEVGVDLYNEVNRQFTQSCFQVGPCHFDITNKDTGWSISTILKIHAEKDRVKLYGLGGLGFIQIRRYINEFAVDDEGELLPNFTIEDTFNGGEALLFHFGAGVETNPEKFPIKFYVEGRATYFFYTYSGGLAGSIDPSLVGGVRIRIGS